MVEEEVSKQRGRAPPVGYGFVLIEAVEKLYLFLEYRTSKMFIERVEIGRTENEVIIKCSGGGPKGLPDAVCGRAYCLLNQTHCVQLKKIIGSSALFDQVQTKRISPQMVNRWERILKIPLPNCRFGPPINPDERSQREPNLRELCVFPRYPSEEQISQEIETSSNFVLFEFHVEMDESYVKSECKSDDTLVIFCRPRFFVNTWLYTADALATSWRKQTALGNGAGRSI